MSRKVKKFKVCSIEHRSKLIFDSKISFLFEYYPFQGSFDHREMWYYTTGIPYTVYAMKPH